MKNKIVIFSLTVISIFINCNSHKNKSDINSANLKKIKLQMKLDSVIKIMGEPDTIIIHPLKNEDYYFGYMYESQWGMSDNHYIYISKKDSLVTNINYGN